MVGIEGVGLVFGNVVVGVAEGVEDFGGEIFGELGDRC